MLGGLRVEYDKGLAGHSDADAVLHAVTDAILGAMAAGDIGDLFPDSDPKWAGADSAAFVRHAAKLAERAGMTVGNCDVTVLAEAPRLGSLKKAMAARIAELLSCPPERVSVKAKTNEQMGFVGSGEGIAAFAAVMLKEELEEEGHRSSFESRKC